MGERSVNENAAVNGTAAENESVSLDALKLKLEHPFEYDEKKYSEIDISKLPEITAGQLCRLDGVIKGEGYQEARPELTRRYAMLVASEMNEMPFDWLMSMRATDSIRLRELVSLFFFGRG